MPNWCDTTYKCVGDPKEVRSLYNVIKCNDNRKTSRVKNGFGKLWLGNIIDQLGYSWEQYRCRGEIIDYQMDGDELVIYQSTAWCEQEGFREVIQLKFPSITVYYRQEESGCDVYSTNSFEYFPERYFLDSYEEPLYFETLSEATDTISSIVGYKVEEDVNVIRDALDKYLEEHEKDDIFYSFHEFIEID